MHSPLWRLLAVTVAVASLLTPRGAARAQALTRPAIPWETIETPSFRIHFPTETRRWVQHLAPRMESYAAAVNALVGSRPATRVTVLVEDPSNVSNGFAVPFLEEPVIFLWPTPPTPSPSFGQFSGWGEILAVHEYGHIAHLTIPSRNPTERLLWRLAPSRIGPVARRSPPWVIEGYATYIEGKLTANGRPHSVGRPAVLRQWALEGRLPTYQGMNGTGPFMGGAMRYLVGSAFLEWLVERKGEESLNHLWRRMSARQSRSFDAAFRGVYGAGPDDLYGVFHTEVVGKALEARRQLQSAGLAEGTLVQKLTWATGEPALSRDGSLIAVVLRAPERPSRLVVWSSRDEPLDSAVIRARRRMLERDPLDVPPFDSFPPPKKVLRTLHPWAGRGHAFPRWFADGERLLVSRDEPMGDGTFRPDLFVWNRKRGGLRRVTHGAGIRSGDPSPDGTRAAAARCHAGICDLVTVDLRSGAIAVVVAGAPDVVWHRPRWSPDGRRIAAGLHREGRWQVAIVDAASGAVREVDPGDGANRHAPAWTHDGRLVVVSERGGVANLELLDPERAATQPLTRVTSGVAAPEVGSDGQVWFLALHAKGYDVRRIALDAALTETAGRTVTLAPTLSPAAPRRTTPADSFPVRPVPPPRDYGLGPRGWRLLPGVSAGPDGEMASLMLASTDPVGRLSVVAQGGYGGHGGWRGGSLAAALRTMPMELEGSAWYTEHEPSEQRAGRVANIALDSRIAGGGVLAAFDREGSAWRHALRAGGSVSRVSTNQLDGAGRAMGFAELRTRLTWTRGSLAVSPQVTLHGASGGTGGDSWRRLLATGALSLGTLRRSLRAEATMGRVTAAGAGEFGRTFEQFAVGGAYLPFIDRSWLSQRVSLPSVPVGYASGSRLELYRLSTRMGGVTPYAVWVAAGDSITRYQRVLGLEQEFDVAGYGFARLPGVRVRYGVGYSLDGPYEGRARPYVSVGYRP